MRTEELDINNFLKEAAGSKRNNLFILCTGGAVASRLVRLPSKQAVRAQGLGRDIVLCSETRKTTGLMGQLACVQTSPYYVLERTGGCRIE